MGFSLGNRSSQGTIANPTFIRPSRCTISLIASRQHRTWDMRWQKASHKRSAETVDPWKHEFFCVQATKDGRGGGPFSPEPER